MKKLNALVLAIFAAIMAFTACQDNHKQETVKLDEQVTD